MRDSWKLYCRYVGISLRAQMQYPASFVMMAAGLFVVTFIEFLGMWALFARFGSIRGWSLSEVALLYGIAHTSFAISEAVARGFDIFHRQVRTGDFDRLLLRPRHTAFQVFGQEFQLMRVGRMAQGLLVLGWAVSVLDVPLGSAPLALLLLSIVGGACLFSGLYMLQATLSFWTVDSLELANMVTHGGVEASQFPLSIYRAWFRNLFIYVVPLAAVTYMPAVAILGKNDPLGFPHWAHWMSPLIGIAFFLVCLPVWSFGVRHYKSTGS